MLVNTNIFDPEEEKGRKRPAYISAKEWRVLLTVTVVVILLLVPVYSYLMALRNSHLCTQNLLDISTAMEGYSEDNNDRFPPLYMADDKTNEPQVFGGNKVFTWVSLLSRYINHPNDFTCPAAAEEEGVINEPGEQGAPIVSDYGMYAALSAFPRGSIGSPDSVALICDSSNLGSEGTSDPLPFKQSSGKGIPDGFIIGLNTSNFLPGDSAIKTLDAATFATRLATPDSAHTGYGAKTRARHPDGLNFLMADLHRIHLPADAAVVLHAGDKPGHNIRGLWAQP